MHMYDIVSNGLAADCQILADQSFSNPDSG